MSRQISVSSSQWEGVFARNSAPECPCGNLMIAIDDAFVTSERNARAYRNRKCCFILNDMAELLTANESFLFIIVVNGLTTKMNKNLTKCFNQTWNTL